MATVIPQSRDKGTLLPPEYPPLPVRRFTVEEYHRLIQSGILKPGDPFELIRGWIVVKMPTNPSHASVVRRLDRRLQTLLGDSVVVGVQQPITTADSEPEPDVSVSRGPESRYLATHPTPGDVHFLVEVSDTTLAYDQGEKLALYAQAKVAIYWIVNVEARRIEVYTMPRGGKKPSYRQRTDYPAGESVPVVIESQTVGAIPVNELLP